MFVLKVLMFDVFQMFYRFAKIVQAFVTGFCYPVFNIQYRVSIDRYLTAMAYRIVDFLYSVIVCYDFAIFHSIAPHNWS